MRRIPTPPKDFNVMQHELLTDGPPPEAPEPTGLMALRFSAINDARGFGVGMLPDEADKAGVCHYSSERLTSIIAYWCEHNMDLANRVMALTAENELLRERLDALELLEAIREAA